MFIIPLALRAMALPAIQIPNNKSSDTTIFDGTRYVSLPPISGVVSTPFPSQNGRPLPPASTLTSPLGVPVPVQFISGYGFVFQAMQSPHLYAAGAAPGGGLVFLPTPSAPLPPIQLPGSAPVPPTATAPGVPLPLPIPPLPSVPLQSFAVPLSVAPTDTILQTGIPTANALPPLALPCHQYSNAFNPGIHQINQLSASHLFAGPTCQLGNLAGLHLSQEQAIQQLSVDHQSCLVSQAQLSEEFPENMSALLYSNGHNELQVPLSGAASELIKTGTDLSSNAQLFASDSFIKMEEIPQLPTTTTESSKAQSKSANAKRGAVKTELTSVNQPPDPSQSAQCSNSQNSDKPKISKRRRDGKPVLSLWNTKAGQVKPARGLLEVLDEVAASSAASVPTPPPQDSSQAAPSSQAPATDSTDGIAKKPRRKRGEPKRPRRANVSETPVISATQAQAQAEHTPALNAGSIFLTNCEPFSMPSTVLNTQAAGIANFGLEAGTDAPDFALLGAGVPPPHELLEHHFLDATGAMVPQDQLRLAYARCAEEMALTATHANPGMEEFTFSSPFSDMNPQIIIIQPNSTMLPLDLMPPPPLAFAAPPPEQSPQLNLMPMQTAPATLSVQSNSHSTIQISSTPKKKVPRKGKAEPTGAASVVGASSTSDGNSELKQGLSTQASAGSNGTPAPASGSSRRSGESRVFWTPQENAALHDGIRMYGVGKWRSILEWARAERGVMQHRSLGSLAKRWYHHEQRRHGPPTGPSVGVDGALYPTPDSAHSLYLVQQANGAEPQLHNTDGTALVKPTRDRRGRPPKLDRDRVTPRKAPKPPAAAAATAPSIGADALAAPPVPVPVAVQQLSDPPPPPQQQQQHPCALAQTALLKLEQVVTAEVPSELLEPPLVMPEHSGLQLQDVAIGASIESPLQQLSESMQLISVPDQPTLIPT